MPLNTREFVTAAVSAALSKTGESISWIHRPAKAGPRQATQPARAGFE